MEKNKETQNKKKALGRGIGSLLGGHSGPAPSREAPRAEMPARASSAAEVKPAAAPESGNRIWNLSVEKLMPSAYQPRQHFKKEDLEELASSIKAKGILQPIIARKSGAGFEIIAGERRWRAAQMAGLHEVPVILKTFDDLETLEMAIIENIQRSDLSPIEEAEAYQRLATQFDMSQAQIAEKVGKERATVANAMRLLQLPKQVREYIAQGLLSAGHSKVLLSLSDDKIQVQLAKKVMNEGLSVRKLEALLKSKLAEKEGMSTQNKSMSSQMDTHLVADIEDKLKKALNTKVNIQYQAGKGQISIHFYDKEQFNQLIEKIQN